MRSALALSALLLLLWPLSSLSQEQTNEGHAVTSKQSNDSQHSSSGSSTASPQPTKIISTASGGLGSNASTVGGDQKNGQGSSQATTAAPTAAPPAAALTTVSATPVNSQTTTRSNHIITTKVMTTKEGSHTASQTQHASNTSSATPAAASWTTPASPQQGVSGPAAPAPPGSSTKGPTASSGPGTVTGRSTPQGATIMPTKSVTLHGHEQISTKMPAITGTSPSVTGISATGTSPQVTGISATGTSPQVTGTLATGTLAAGTSTSDTVPPRVSSSSGPGAIPHVRATSYPTHLAPTSPQGSNIPSPTPALKDNRVKCEPPERLNETWLILNLTSTSLCAGSPPDDKLVTLLCRAAKANFNPSRDQCQIRLVPALDTQAVAIRDFTIQTKFPPKDLYDLLKDKWDELKEVGVSNMQLGNQGPPEETEDRFSMPLIITIICMASFLLLVAALYGCCHQHLSHRKDQQRLTEELQTVENGYHDNPTLEVMETSSEMQEKKVVNLNGELGDSWIVPLDNLMKDDLDEEEDTHL